MLMVTAVFPSTEMPSRKSEEHKSRVLSAAVDGGLPETESVIKEVTDGAIEKVDAFGKVDAEKPESVEDSKVNNSNDSGIMPTSISQIEVHIFPNLWLKLGKTCNVDLCSLVLY